MPLFIDTAEVARRLDLDAEEFRRRRAMLHDLHGLPQPMAGFHRPLVWRETAVTAWLAGFNRGLTGLPAQPDAVPLPPNLRLLRAATVAH